MSGLLILFVIPIAFLAACNRTAPTATVELIDTSLSIEPKAEASALGAVRGQIQQMRRGDRLILIPITGNAANDAGGRILRLQAPTERKPYDADLRRFREEAKKQFDAWAAARGTEPNRTDILGSLDVARQEIASLPTGSTRRLIIVSDFLEDDGQYDFVSDPSVANASLARRMALRLRDVHGFASPEAPPCLGRLASLDYGRLSPDRKEAVDAFWKTYLAGDGRPPEIQIDGVGIIEGANGARFNEAGTSDRRQGNTP